MSCPPPGALQANLGVRTPQELPTKHGAPRPRARLAKHEASVTQLPAVEPRSCPPSPLWHPPPVEAPAVMTVPMAIPLGPRRVRPLGPIAVRGTGSR